MTSVIQEIYNHLMAKGFAVTPEYRELCRENAALWDEIQPLLTKETVEKLMDSQNDMILRTNLDWFREGVRIGAAFMLEVL